uniref:SVWC domain-containing protein n=1 Tax=Glossina pallidipes TaxID=7398 RepID=A0A1A9ZKY7_GLOPL
MKSFLLLTIICAIFAFGFAAESTGFYKDPRHPGKCYINDDLILSGGEQRRHTDYCARVICGGEGYTTIQTCGVESAVPPCKLGDYVDPDGDYPDCCKRIVKC